MKKKTYVLGMAVMLAGLLALSGVAQSAMWVGGELGGNFNAYPTVEIERGRFDAARQTELRPSVIGGVTVGYDFVNYGFGAANYPAWLGYFSFALDFTYNKIGIQDAGPGIGAFIPFNSRIDISESVLTFLFMFHYGFMRDSEVPSGRINPYLGIGPGLVWTTARGTLPFFNLPNQPARSSNFGADAMNVALVIEPGVRFMVLRNVSIDVAMRYRYSAPSWDSNGFTVKTSALNQFAPLVRASLHF